MRLTKEHIYCYYCGKTTTRKHAYFGRIRCWDCSLLPRRVTDFLEFLSWTDFVLMKNDSDKFWEYVADGTIDSRTVYWLMTIDKNA